jgi:hypothetical protein
MPVRVLKHGNAPTLEGVALEPGTIKDVQPQGLFLVDLEFLTRYTARGANCVYVNSPSYLPQIAEQFPWVHFHAFSHVFPLPEPEPGEEYSPEKPDIQGWGAVTMQTHGNITRSSLPYNRENARVSGDRMAGGLLVLICHGEDPSRQLFLHALSRPAFSLLDVASLPDDYVDGELILPIYCHHGKALAFLIASGRAVARSYCDATFQQELGFLQAILRNSSAYDDESRDLIVSKYAEQYHQCLGWPQMVLELNVRFALSTLSQPEKP